MTDRIGTCEICGGAVGIDDDYGKSEGSDGSGGSETVITHDICAEIQEDAERREEHAMINAAASRIGR